MIIQSTLPFPLDNQSELEEYLPEEYNDYYYYVPSMDAYLYVIISIYEDEGILVNVYFFKLLGDKFIPWVYTKRKHRGTIQYNTISGYTAGLYIHDDSMDVVVKVPENEDLDLYHLNEQFSGTDLRNVVSQYFRAKGLIS